MNLNNFRTKYAWLSLVLVIVLLTASICGCSKKVVEKTAEPTNLTVNLMSEPLGVKLNSLRFGWQTNDPDSDEKQTAYRIVISKTRDNFNNGNYLYDTDWVISSKSTGVRLDGVGSLLNGNSLYYWAVATKDKDGNISNFSSLQSFTTDVSDAWVSCKGIWAEEEGAKSDDSFVFLRSYFNAERISEIEKVTASVTATDTETARQYVYNLYINGNCIGMGPCRKGKGADGKEILYYNTYDITKYIMPDKNVVSAINYADTGKSFLLQITAFYSDGSSQVWLNSGRDYNSWKSLPGDSVFGKSNSIGTGYYTAYANNIDANIYPFGFSESEFDDSDWNGCYLDENINNSNALKSVEYYPLKRFEREGASVSKLENGDYLVDLKQEIVGGLKIDLEGQSGQKVNLYYGEQLNSDGSVKWQMNTRNNYKEVFTLKEGKQTISTIDMLTYRYIQISGYDNELSASSVKGLEVRAEFDDDASNFKSDSKYLNDIYKLCKNTIKYTTQDIMVDSQSRERRCYEGDLLINMLASYAVSSNMCSARFSLEYILTHRTDFIDYRLLSVVIAMQDYLYTGDDEVLKEYYGILKENCYFLDKDSNGFVITENGDNLVIDWPETDRDGYDMSVKRNTALNCIQFKAYESFAFIAKAVGNDADSNIALEKAESLKQAIIDKMYVKDKGAFCDGICASGIKSQHFAQQATAYALWAGIYTDSMISSMVDHITLNNEVKCSVYGLFFLLDGLYKSGNGDKANAMLLNDAVTENSKTYSYMMNILNATLTTEAWNETIKDNMTLSHPWSSSPAYFINSGICGIEPSASGFEKFYVLLPKIYGFSNCEYSFETAKGRICVEIRKEAGERYCINIDVPVNTTAILKVKYKINSVYINGKETELTENNSVYEIGSGKTVVNYSVG